jgi:putative ABC transport system permease protein
MREPTAAGFRAFVRGHIEGLDLAGVEELKIVEELGAQLEEAYERALSRGLSPAEAWSDLERHLADWRTLGRELLETEAGAIRRTGVRGSERAPAPVTTANAAWPGGRPAWLLRGIENDLRVSLRRLWRDRAFTATVVLTLAICLGANGAVFTLVRSVLLRPLPIPQADRIVALGDVFPTAPDDILSNTAPAYLDRLEALPALEEQALFAPWFDSLVVEGVAEELRGVRATPSFFRLLRTPPALGRAFVDGDGEPGSERKIILSHGLWQRLFGGDPSALGRKLRLGWTGESYEVVGVMPKGFAFFERDDGHARSAGDAAQFWIPIAFTAAQKSEAARSRYAYYHVGRLRPGTTIEQVQAQVEALNLGTARRFPQLRQAELGLRTAVTPLHDALTRGVRSTLLLLWGGAVFVLLIGALNLANLALARASGRTRELATRLALGGGRREVTRQLIVEGVSLTLLGGLAGFGVAASILRLLAATGMAHLPNATDVRLDGFVITGFLAASVLVGVSIGLVPAASLGGLRLRQVLAAGSRLNTAGRANGLFRRALVVAQVGVSLMLLIGAGLLFASFRNLLQVDAGFQAERVTTATIFPPPSRYADSRAVAELSDRVLESIDELPGVTAAGIGTSLALSGGAPAAVAAGERPQAPGAVPLRPTMVSVTPRYLEAMGTTVLRGRAFSDADRESAAAVALVDERLAAKLWPGEDPVGKAVVHGDAATATVVGVVRTVRFEGLDAGDDSDGAIYLPHRQAPPMARLRWIAVKAAIGPAAVARGLRTTLRGIDPALPLSDIQTMHQRTVGSVAPQRLAMGLASGFGLVALLLSMLGIYGVLAYLVAQRTREFAIRTALGATSRDSFRLVLREGALLVGCGLAVGLVGAVALRGVLQGQLFAVTSTDPFVVGAAVFVTAAVAMAACIRPAQRATRVEPMQALTES